MAGRVQQRLREMAGVAYSLAERERLSDMAYFGDHATFRQQAVQFFGAAPANMNQQDYILELHDAVQTQKSFYARLNAGPVTVRGMPISGRWDARRAKQRKNFLFLAREGADDSFAAAHSQYFLRDGDLDPGPNGELFDDFATWTMREHPD